MFEHNSSLHFCVFFLCALLEVPCPVSFSLRLQLQLCKTLLLALTKTVLFCNRQELRVGRCDMEAVPIKMMCFNRARTQVERRGKVGAEHKHTRARANLQRRSALKVQTTYPAHQEPRAVRDTAVHIRQMIIFRRMCMDCSCSWSRTFR